MLSSFETILRGDVTGPIRKLRGFSAQRRAPDKHDAAAAHYIETLAAAEISDRAEELFQTIRRAFRYKRRELQIACDGGGASIQTPDFDLTLMLTQHPEVPADFQLRTEIRNFRNSEIVDSEAFLSAFNAHCDAVVLQSPQPVDLEEMIDRIEEVDELADLLDYDSQCTRLTLAFPKLSLEVTQREMLFRLSGPASRDLPHLLAETKTAIEKFAGTGAFST